MEEKVVWKERKHEDDDSRDGSYVGFIASLWGCGFLKFFNVPNMRSHVNLLKYIYYTENVEPKTIVFQSGVPHP